MTGPEYPGWSETGSQREYHDLARIGAVHSLVAPAYVDALRDTVYVQAAMFERQRIADEMAEYARELYAAGRPSASAIVKGMWQRVVRRLDR